MSMRTTGWRRHGIALALGLAMTASVVFSAPAAGAGQGAEVRSGGGPADPRSDHHHRLHHAQPWLHGVRRAVRDRRQVPGPAADGRQVGGQQGQPDLHVHAARRPEVPRRRAGEVGRLHRLDRTLGQARRLRPAPRRDDRVVDRGQRQDLPPEAEEAVPVRARGARQAVVERAVHHARAHREDRRQHRDHRPDRLRPVQDGQGPVGPGQQGRVREEHRLRAAQGSAVLGRRRQGREGRSRRVDLHPGRGHRRRRAEQRRGRLVAAGPDRPDPRAREEQGRQGRERRSARLDRPAALQPPAAAVQQREAAPGGAGRGQPERLRDRHRRRRQERQALPVVLHLRHADGEHRRARRP